MDCAADKEIVPHILHYCKRFVEAWTELKQLIILYAAVKSNCSSVDKVTILHHDLVMTFPRKTICLSKMHSSSLSPELAWNCDLTDVCLYLGCCYVLSLTDGRINICWIVGSTSEVYTFAATLLVIGNTRKKTRKNINTIVPACRRNHLNHLSFFHNIQM